jgi:hypothetical protein
MNNKTQRRIHKYFFSHYFCFVFFRKNNIRGNAATNNTPNEGRKESSRKGQGSRKLQYLPRYYNFFDCLMVSYNCETCYPVSPRNRLGKVKFVPNLKVNKLKHLKNTAMFINFCIFKFVYNKLTFK